MKIFYSLANSVDPVEMLHSMAFHQLSLFVKVRILEPLASKGLGTEDLLVAAITVCFLISHIL